MLERLHQDPSVSALPALSAMCDVIRSWVDRFLSASLNMSPKIQSSADVCESRVRTDVGRLIKNVVRVNFEL